MPTFQSFDVSVQTASDGTFEFTFDTDIDQVYMTCNNPQVGVDNGLIGGTCNVTGAKTVTGRVWRTGANFTAKPAANEQVGVSLLGVKN